MGNCKMCILTVWSLVVGFVPVACSLTSSSCDMLWTIGSCETVYGPAISCSQQLYDHVTSIKQLTKRLPNDRTYSEAKILSLELYKLKTAIDNLMYFVRETVAQHQNVPNEACVSIVELEKWSEEIETYLRGISPIFLWMDQLVPIFGTVIFILGMVGNLVIVLIYVRHEDLQTGSNTAVLNLALSDIFLLLIHIPLNVIILRYMSYETYFNSEWVLDYLDIVCVTANVYSLVVLNLMKFLATYSKPGSRIQEFIEDRKAIRKMLVLIWVLATIIGVIAPLYTLFITDIKLKLALLHLRLVFLCALPLFAITVFSVATARVLRRGIPGEKTTVLLQETRARRKGVNVLLSFIVVFCVTHVPINIIILIDYFERPHYSFVTVLLMTLNSCLNPVALFISSRNFRNHSKTDLCELKHKISNWALNW